MVQRVNKNPFAFLEAWGITDTGQKRTENQDDILVRPEEGVFVVADGVGGIQGGRVASTTITESLGKICDDDHSKKFFKELKEKETVIKLRLLQVNDWLISQADAEKKFHPCSTVTLFIFSPDRPDQAASMHLGDTDLYRFRDDEIESIITRHEDSDLPGNAISRAMGAHSPLNIEHNVFILQPEDYYLICSDGLYRMLSDQEMADVFRQKREEGVKAITETLVEYANLAGGTDNISAIVIHIKSDYLPLPAPEDETVEIDQADPSDETVDIDETIAGDATKDLRDETADLDETVVD
jgi:protein phosphatase